MNNDEYFKIYQYLKMGELPSSLNTSHARFGFKRKCRCYEIDAKEDAIYYVQKHKDGSIRRRAKVVVGTIEDAKAVFKETHCNKPIPHFGLNRSLQEISKHYFWPRMTYDVMEWIRECPACLKTKTNNKPKLQQMKISEPWEILMMNIIGPVDETKEGYKFIFTAIDFYSKWVEAFPISNKYPAEVAACLKLIFYRHGAWKSVLSNEKLEFVEAINNELYKQFGGEHHVKIVYHPDVMSLDKRCDDEVENVFNTLVVDHALDWPHYIDGLLFTMRTRKHPATKHTPFYLLHKREARIPPASENDPVANIDSVFDLSNISQPNYQSTAAHDKSAEIRTHERTIENLKEARLEQVIDNALAVSEQDKERQFVIGEKVLLTTCRKRPLDLTSGDALASGPYVVTDVKPNKVKVMSTRDYTQVKVVTEPNRLVPYKETYKLSFFEPVSSGEDATAPSTTFQIITCDPRYNADEMAPDGEDSLAHLGEGVV